MVLLAQVKASFLKFVNDRTRAGMSGDTRGRSLELFFMMASQTGC